MARVNVAARKFICFLLMLICFSPLVGCIGLVANLLNVVGGGLVPAAFAGLRDRKVAVVCVSNSQLFGPTNTSAEVSVRINRLLKNKVKHIQLVSYQEVADWIDRNNWDMVDFRTIGEGVGADMVVAIDIDSLSIHEGKTMYKGRSDVHIVVYDIHSGHEVYAKSPPQIVYPVTGGVFDIPERRFRKQFLDILADRLARNFYAYDINEDYARDVEAMSAI